VQAYAGHVQHVFNFDERRTINRVANERLRAIVDALSAAGFPPGIVSGGGTGSHRLDFDDKILTEVQAGSYIFMDEAYRPVEMQDAGGEIFRFALFVAVTVTAHSANGEAITDGGTKSFAVDGPPPRAFLDGVEIGTIVWAGDEFGRLKTHDGYAPPAAGMRLECTVPHCDPTSNLHDVIHLVRGDSLEASGGSKGAVSRIDRRPPGALAPELAHRNFCPTASPMMATPGRLRYFAAGAEVSAGAAVSVEAG
jgi:D-serine deaminase-like pyridoxal phosphate-dependent protein